MRHRQMVDPYTSLLCRQASTCCIPSAPLPLNSSELRTASLPGAIQMQTPPVAAKLCRMHPGKVATRQLRRYKVSL